MEILTAAEMTETDRRTIADAGVSMAELMENAGAAVARFVLRQYPAATRVMVLCGKGNNGGDGLVAARRLAEAGRQVMVLLLAAEQEYRGESWRVLAMYRSGEGAARQCAVATDADAVASLEFAAADLVLDAVVGTGFKPPLRGIAVALRERLASLAVPVVAVDLPSGWDADSLEESSAEAFRASAVVTFTRPKLAHVFGHMTPGTTFGPVVVAEIGSPDAAVREAISADGPSAPLRWTGSAKAIAEVPRPIQSNKGMYGHVLLIAGSYGTAGAPSMASLAALRTGAGLVTAAVPRSILNLVAMVAPELMMTSLEEGAEGAVSLENLAPERLAALLKRKTVIAVGPGLSTRGEAPEFVRRLVAKTRLPMVIDADGLNAFEGRTEQLQGAGRTLVLTPHPGEMARLAGITVKEVEADRLGLARRFATEHQVTLVLKGWRTLVAHPDGAIAVNTTGNPALAKGGSGDILTGIVAAMVAQFPNDVARAVEAAVYLHGLAGDLAVCGPVDSRDEHAVLATDTVAHLSAAFRYRVRDAEGLSWVAGVHG